MMAEGGFDPTETTEKTPLIPKGGNDDDDDDDKWRDVDLSLYPISEEEEAQVRTPDPDPTNSFEPGAPSTPAGGENIPMTTRLPPERQGARGGTAETSFSTGFNQGVTTQDAMVRRELDSEFPHASSTELEFRYRRAPKSGGAIIEVRYHTSETWYPLFTKSRGDLEKTFNTSLPAQIINALGKSTTDEIKSQCGIGKS